MVTLVLILFFGFGLTVSAVPVCLSLISGCSRPWRLFLVGFKALAPMGLPGAYRGVLVQTLDGRPPEQHEHPTQESLNQLFKEFDITTERERCTFSGWFRAVGVLPWVWAFLTWMLCLAFYGASKNSSSFGITIFCFGWPLWFPAFYRAGTNALAGSLSSSVFYGRIGWVSLALVVEDALRFIAFVAIGLVVAPVHAITFTFKWYRFIKELRGALANS